MRKVEARHLFRFSDLIGDRHLAAISTIPEPELSVVILSSKEKPYGWVRNTEDGLQKAKLGWTYHYQVHHWTRRDCSTLNLVETGRDFDYVERLGVGEWLLAGSRIIPQQKRNAVVFNDKGRQIDSLFFSDAVRSIQATSEGNFIWVSYFDEGVFSEYDLSSEGLVCFNRNGEPVYRYHTQLRENNCFALDQISDCYALNVPNDQDVWVYYYPSFPLVKIQNGTIRKVWHDLGIAGSKLFAVTEERALFGRGYHEEGLYLVTLSQERCPGEKIRSVDYQGNDIPITQRSFARGARLYLPRGDDLFVLELDYDL